LAADALNKVVKHERRVGVTDHVVVTDEIYRRLSPDLQGRLSAAPLPDEHLGTFYILERQKATVSLQLNERTSENIHGWIVDFERENHFDFIDIFAYTNETLYKFLGSQLPGSEIRVLARNWLQEAQEEREYNRQFASQANPSSEGSMRRPWVKSTMIRSAAEMLVEHGANPPQRGRIELRFYDSGPWLKGVLLRNSKTGERAGHIGLYAWDPMREGGGSPYVGEHWTGLWLVDDNGGPQSYLLNTIQARFEELWSRAHSFEKLKLLESEQAQQLVKRSSMQRIWEINGLPYLIIVPGRKVEGRPFPSVAAEDLVAMRLIESLLKGAGAQVDVEIVMGLEPSKKIPEWIGHLIFICHRTLDEKIRKHLKAVSFPYSFEVDSNDRPRATHEIHRVSFESPMDLEPPATRDYCVIGKCDMWQGEGKLFILAGLHGMGTVGGGHFVTQPDDLQRLCDVVDSNNFAALLESEFEIPLRHRMVHIVMGPEVLQKEVDQKTTYPSSSERKRQHASRVKGEGPAREGEYTRAHRPRRAKGKPTRG